MPMPADVTIDGVTYTVSRLESGNILVEYTNGQYNPMHGPGTQGIHRFEVHPCQRPLFSSWRKHLPPEEQEATGPGRDGAEPWWSMTSARTDTATGAMRLGGRPPDRG
jgi:hypothetical protein